MNKWKMYVQTPDEIEELGEFEGPWVDAIGHAGTLAQKFAVDGKLVSVGVCRSDISTSSFVTQRKDKVHDTHWTRTETKRTREKERKEEGDNDGDSETFN